MRRQLLAYTLDRWVTTDLDLQALPRKLKPVLDAIEQSGKSDGAKEAFPYTWLSWVEAQQRELLQRFVGLFDQTLTTASRQLLAEGFLNPHDTPFNAPYAQELIERLEQLVAERKRLTAESRRLFKKFNDYNARNAALTEQQLSLIHI